MPFPYEESAKGFLSDRWNKDTYLFLSNFIRTLHIYPRATPDEHGLYEITFNPDGTEARIPIPDFGGESDVQASICATLGASSVECTGGQWTHRYDPVTVPTACFWFGDPDEAPEHSIPLANGANYGFVEFLGGTCTWGVQGTYPLNATNVLRRCVFYADLSGGVVGTFRRHNVGDIYT